MIKLILYFSKIANTSLRLKTRHEKTLVREFVKIMQLSNRFFVVNNGQIQQTVFSSHTF